MRVFIAIPVPETVRNALEEVQEELRSVLQGEVVRWTKRTQFHLTLRFLGDVDSTQVQDLAHSLRQACEPFAPLPLRAERIGFFPHMRSPRVVWAWVHDSNEVLPRLQQSIERAVAKFTREAVEEKFTGHVTLGRVKRIRRAEADALGKIAVGMAERFFGEWTANHVELIQSELSSEGSRYRTLDAVELARALKS
jgi:2'-5' RNA ligase